MSTPVRRVEHAGLAVDSEGTQIEESAAAQVFHERNVSAARQSDQFFEAGLFGEAGDFEVRTMHAEQEPCALGDGLFVVANAGTVSGADLTQSGVRFLHDVGDAKRAADFDEFAAGNDDFSVFGQRVER